MKYQIQIAGTGRNLYPSGKMFKSVKSAQNKLQDLVNRNVISGVPIVIVESK